MLGCTYRVEVVYACHHVLGLEELTHTSHYIRADA